VSRLSRRVVQAESNSRPSPGLWFYVSTPHPLTFTTRRQLALPSSRVIPVSTCPVLRPRWCPAHSPRRYLRWRYPLRSFGCAWSLMSTIASPYRVQDCCLPLFAQRRLSPLFSSLSLCPRLYPFRGSIARPVPLIPPASYSRYRFCTWGSLPACWLDFSWVGLAALCCSPTGQH
jgi:hypothetical protein